MDDINIPNHYNVPNLEILSYIKIPENIINGTINETSPKYK